MGYRKPFPELEVTYEDFVGLKVEKDIPGVIRRNVPGKYVAYADKNAFTGLDQIFLILILSDGKGQYDVIPYIRPEDLDNKSKLTQMKSEIQWAMKTFKSQYDVIGVVEDNRLKKFINFEEL